jgi:ATP-dependent Lon protease
MAHTDIRLAVAEERTIYEVAAIDRAMEEAAGNRNEALASLYDKMKQRGGGRFLIRPTGADMIDDLYDSCPNISEVIDDLKYVALSGGDSFTPSCCSANPVSARHFARELANRLGTGHEFISMSS